MCVTQLAKSSPPSWFMRSSCQDSTTATLSWQVCPSQRPTLYNAYKMQLRISYLGSERMIMRPRPCVNCTGCRYTSASNTNCAPWFILFITECARRTSPTQFPPSPTTRHDLVCTLPSARCISYRDVVRRWASVHSPSLANSRGTLFLQPSVTLLIAHVSENFSKHTSLIHYLSFLPYAFL